jgi:hypothetical protein
LETVGSTGAGDDTEACFGESEGSGGSEDAEIEWEGEFETPAEGGASYSCDGGDGEVLKVLEGLA